jgi:uncharacterized OB-fold protein
MTETNHKGGWPQPYRLPDAEPYWEALGNEQLKYQRCTSCDNVVWPAHSYCPQCGRKSLEWQTSSGRGSVYSFSTVMRGPTPVWQALVPYTVGFVQMEEGYFLFTQIDGDPQTIEIGEPVQVRFVRRGEQVLPIFGPVP